jgi:hypothetical protein
LFACHACPGFAYLAIVSSIIAACKLAGFGIWCCLLVFHLASSVSGNSQVIACLVCLLFAHLASYVCLTAY